LVSLVILTIALAPTLALTNFALHISTSLRNNLVAAGLTQEGIEVVRALRDNNWLSGKYFNEGLGDDDAIMVYRAQWDSSSLIEDDPNMKLKLNNGVYSYSIGNDTPFSRVITITRISPQELKITSTVSWQERGRSRSIQAESHLFNWKK